MAKTGKKDKSGKGGMSNNARVIIFWVVVTLTITLFWVFGSSRTQLEQITISQVISGANSGEIVKIQGQGGDLTITEKGNDEPTQKSYIDGGISTLLQDDSLSDEAKQQVLVDEPVSQTSNTLWNLAIIIVPILVIGGLFLYMMRQAQGQN